MFANISAALVTRFKNVDNERGSANLCHFDGQEIPCRFMSVEPLFEDFIAAVSGVCCPYTSMHIDMYLKAA